MEESWSNSFDSVNMNEAQVAHMNQARDAFKRLADELQSILPTDGNAGRYRSIVKTKLEEASLMATKCISRSSELK